MRSPLRPAVLLSAVVLELTAQPVRLMPPRKHSQSLENAAAIFTRRVQARCGSDAASGARPVSIELRVRPGLGADGFSISHGPRGSVIVTGNEDRGVLYGLGKLFRNSQCESGTLIPGPWRGTSRPVGSLRGTYLASHFGNFYEAAPIRELETYVEDLGLWGVNAVGFAFPVWQYESFDDPPARINLKRITAMMKAAKRAGMQVGIFIAPNQAFKTAPAELHSKPYPDDWKRRGDLGTNVCPSIPAGHQYLLDMWARLLNEYRGSGLDFVTYWPYDEGGCGCEQCWPWGSRGYARLCRDFTKVARTAYPNMKVVLSTWMFDSPPAGEWDGLATLLKRDRSWIDYILADAHEDFPRYPLEKGVPGGLPLLNFPEISMWGMSPWGGYGANPLPERAQALWNQVADKVSGGFPYSEGVYEDLNAVIYSQFYWDPKQTALETMTEYVASEFSLSVTGPVLQAIAVMEANHSRRNARFEKPAQRTAEALQMMREADAKLTPQVRRSWRWRILFLRALIDDELSRNGPRLTPTLHDAFSELVRIYHAEHVHTIRVAPPALQP